ncbi:hypothetical protein C0992_010290 [Termitomyces sp. T32_za158]|nr:hypothetical protein C0992_010290 [Termitomyces sp. T32_za158]
MSAKSKTPTSKIRFAQDVMGVGNFTTETGHADDTPSSTSSPSNNSKRRSWRAVRRTVSHMLHREHKEKDKDILLFATGRTVPSAISSPRALKPSKSVSFKAKSSSPSISTNRTRRSVKRLTSPSPRFLAEQQAQAMARQQHLHRSRSFSGYSNVLTVLTDECSEVDTDIGLDEATMEAQEVMKDLRRKQVFTRIRGMDRGDEPTGIMFQRGR